MKRKNVYNNWQMIAWIVACLGALVCEIRFEDYHNIGFVLCYAPMSAVMSLDIIITVAVAIRISFKDYRKDIFKAIKHLGVVMGGNLVSLIVMVKYPLFIGISCVLVTGLLTDKFVRRKECHDFTALFQEW